MTDLVISAGDQRVGLATGRPIWTREYLRRTVVSDFVIAAACSMVAIQIRFGGHLGLQYALFSIAFPLLWVRACRSA